MTDIFKEAKHDLQQEKLHLAIRKYYKGAIALITIILLSTSLYVYVRETNIRENEELSEEYYNLFISENKISTIKESDFGKLTTFKKSIYSKFAKMQYVNYLIQAKKHGKAIQLLFYLIEYSKDQPEISNLAKIKVAELVMKHNITSYNTKVLDILQKAISKENTVPYFYMIKLLLGQLLIEDGKQEKALGILKDLGTDDKAPKNLRFFSNAILENYLQ
jgi:predicted negative regulator of RcsB-dependent stress response